MNLRQNIPHTPNQTPLSRIYQVYTFIDFVNKKKPGIAIKIICQSKDQTYHHLSISYTIDDTEIKEIFDLKDNNFENQFYNFRNELLRYTNIDYDKFNMDYIARYICDYFNVSIELILYPTRKREIVQIRQIIQFMSKHFTKESLANIGSQIGEKDHATVLHACKVVNNLYQTDKKLRLHIQNIWKMLCQISVTNIPISNIIDKPVKREKFNDVKA